MHVAWHERETGTPRTHLLLEVKHCISKHSGSTHYVPGIVLNRA